MVLPQRSIRRHNACDLCGCYAVARVLRVLVYWPLDPSFFTWLIAHQMEIISLVIFLNKEHETEVRDFFFR